MKVYLVAQWFGYGEGEDAEESFVFARRADAEQFLAIREPKKHSGWNIYEKEVIGGSNG